MIDFTVYNLETGQILRVGSCFDDLVEHQPQADEGVIEGRYDQATTTLLMGVPSLRPTQLTVLDKLEIIANGVDAVTISNAPSGLFTAINIETGELVSGTLSGSDTFMTTVKGRYKLTLIAFPFLDFEAVINAL